MKAKLHLLAIAIFTLSTFVMMCVAIADAVAAPLYPTGKCDTLREGLPGLNGAAPDELRQIGTSVEGQPIWAEHWGSSSGAVYVVIAQVHGNECAPSLVVDEIRTNPPTGYSIWLIPTMNPDGYARYSRKNANGVDLNADGLRRSQPETQALFDFVAEVQPTSVIHIHSPNGFVGTYGGAGDLGRRIGDALGFRVSGAGERTGRDWFLWQGLAQKGTSSVLVEIHAISDLETPRAHPRPATRNIADVRDEVRAMLRALTPQKFGRLL